MAGTQHKHEQKKPILLQPLNANTSIYLYNHDKENLSTQHSTPVVLPFLSCVCLLLQFDPNFVSLRFKAGHKIATTPANSKNNYFQHGKMREYSQKTISVRIILMDLSAVKDWITKALKGIRSHCSPRWLASGQMHCLVSLSHAT